MTAATFYFILALAMAALAIAIWQRSMPRLLEARGRFAGLVTWALGMVLAVEAGNLMQLSAVGAPFIWSIVARDVLLCAYGLARYCQTLPLSAATWRTFQLKGREPCSPKS